MPPLPATSAARAPDVTPPPLRSAILGSGAYVPEGVLSNADLEAMVATSDAWIVERTGIRERHKVGAGQTATTLALEAGRRALAQAGAGGVDALIVATCSPETPVPPTACLVQRELDLGEVPAFDLNAACSGYVYGLTLADSLIATRRAARVLLIGVDVLTALVDYGDRTTCVLFGDAAGASVVGAAAGGGVQAIEWGADGREAGLIYYGSRTGEPGSPSALRMGGKGTYRLAVERMCEVARSVCAKAGWTPAEVDLLIPHQANLRIIESAAKRLDIPMERVVVNIDRFGNTSAASIPVALCEAVSSGRLHDGQRVLLLAFGAGVTWGGVAIRWTGSPR
jgi:3-oxoacyl-[acyl-carrier-protein] synthase III